MTQCMAEDVQVSELGVKVVVDWHWSINEVIKVVQENNDPVGAKGVKGKKGIGSIIDFIVNKGGAVVTLIMFLAHGVDSQNDIHLKEENCDLEDDNKDRQKD